MDDKIKLVTNKLITYLYPELKKEQQEVLIYGLLIMISFIIDCLALIIVAYLFDILTLALTVAVSASLIKIFSGGVHASSMIRCAVSGVVVFTGLALLAEKIAVVIVPYILSLVILVFSLAVIMLYFYAPVGVKEKPIKNQDKYFKLKKYSLGMLIILASIYLLLVIKGVSTQFIVAGLLGLIWQLFSLTPLAYCLFGRQYLKAEYNN